MQVPGGGREIGATLLAAAFMLAPALAQNAAPPAMGPSPAPSSMSTSAAPTAAAAPTATTPLDAKRLELRGLQDGLDAADARRKAKSGEIAGLEADRAKLETTLLDTTRKVGEDETKASAQERKLDELLARETAIKGTLQSRRAVVVEVLAALQRMGRKPPPALLVDPDDVLKAIRTSMLLGTLVPGMRAEIDALVADLTELSRTRAAAESERRRLDSDLASLAETRKQLSALIDARQAALGTARHEMDADGKASVTLATKAGSLKELIGSMERETAAASQAAEAARTSDAKLAALIPEGGVKPPSPIRDPARLAPAIAFVSTKGLLPRPVSGGRVLRRFGEDDGLGSAEKGEVVATRAAAVVAAPADGWIAFAGPYRSFGELLILNVGGGYYIVLAGMERINVDLGQFVLAGEPVAVMGDGSAKTANAVALGVTQPILYVEFRKDGTTIDPGPWWARPELQKVRG